MYAIFLVIGVYVVLSLTHTMYMRLNSRVSGHLIGGRLRIWFYCVGCVIDGLTILPRKLLNRSDSYRQDSLAGDIDTPPLALLYRYRSHVRLDR